MEDLQFKLEEEEITLGDELQVGLLLWINHWVLYVIKTRSAMTNLKG